MKMVKKISCVLFAVCVLAACCASLVAVSADEFTTLPAQSGFELTAVVGIEGILGDANGDEVINLFDLMAIRAHILEDPDLADPFLTLADVAPLGDPDGEVDVADMVAVRNHILGVCSASCLIGMPI